MKNVYLLFICWMMSSSVLMAQISFSGGPITGAVTSGSAKIYIRTTSPAFLKLEYGTDPVFNVRDTLLVATEAAYHNAIQISLNNLQPDSRYYYRFLQVDNQSIISDTFKFRTFPSDGTPSNIRLIVGSCNYNNGPGGGQGKPEFQE